MEKPLTREFKPSRSGRCLCGSGARFKNCCGSLAPNRPPPHGVRIVHDFITAGDCRELITALQDQPRKPLGTIAQPSENELIQADYGQDRIADEVDATG